MKQLIYNNNLQPDEIAFDKVYFANLLQETKHSNYFEAQETISPVIKAIINKLRPGELNALIQMIENIR